MLLPLIPTFSKGFFFRTVTLMFCWLCSFHLTYGQQRFTGEMLSNAKKYGHSIEQSISTIETPRFIPTASSTKVYLENGLRSSNYLNQEAWTSIKNTVIAKSISLVFSKYPIRKNGYSMNHPLLLNRLKKLFALDPLLNSNDIEWRIILHTDCFNDTQVSSLFHGVVIEFAPSASQSDVAVTEIDPSNPIQTLDRVELLDDLPEDVILKIQDLDPGEKREVLIDHFQKLLDDTTTIPITPEVLKKYEELAEQFIWSYGGIGDSVVFNVLDRNPQWKNALVIGDWTGSMYRHGAQVLLWHTLNFEKSGIEYVTLFNDGDLKSTRAKKIGATGGIYITEADKVNSVYDLYRMVMLKGGGGDGPENDIEAILLGMEQFPAHSEIILVADNSACVRDIELLDYIDEPVRVIVCGYDERVGINPQYLKIAQQTSGSLHTIENDIHELQITLNKKGEVKSVSDYNLKIASPNCNENGLFPTIPIFSDSIFTNLYLAKRVSNQVVNLDLSNQELTKVPFQVRRFKQLRTLDLSHNNIPKISQSIINGPKLRHLDLSNNQIKSIPIVTSSAIKLQALNLSNNQIDTISTMPRLSYLVHLDLSGNGLSDLPTHLNLRSLKELNLGHNTLVKIPSSVYKLRRLEALSLSDNAIVEISPNVGYLTRLEILDLSDNNLSQLPKQIVQLRKLKTLVLTGNNFSEGYIKNLKRVLPNTDIKYQ